MNQLLSNIIFPKTDFERTTFFIVTEGLAGVTSRDGRHVAMMPHPERCVLRWQCPVPAPAAPRPADPSSQASPWQRLFQNAYLWANKQ